MKKNVFIIIALLLASCSSSQPKYLKLLVEEHNKSYQEIKKKYFIPQEIFAHFPNKILESYPVASTISLEDIPYRYFFLITLNNNKSFFDKTEKLAKELAIKTFSANDTMQYYVIQSNSFYYKMQDLLLNSVPIPDFRFGSDFVNDCDTIGKRMIFDLYFSDNFLCGLTTDYNIYIIDNQNEYKTFSDKYKDIFASLPRTKNTGFSRGMCINKKLNIIIFWTMIY